MLPKFIDKAKIPNLPGVYLYKNKEGKVIYCGKAINLSKRVSSYFNRYNNPRIATLVENIADIETIVVQSELEALILEANLIKSYKPQFNIKLMDDKEYLYIKISDEDFPKILTARKSQLMVSKDYFGPFPSSTVVKETLKKLRRVFKWCNNPPLLVIKDKEKVLKLPAKPCFYYHLKLCSGACAGVVNRAEYRKQIGSFIKFLSGQGGSLVHELEKKMKDSAKEQNFEEANAYKKMIEGISYLRASTSVANYLANPNFIDDVRQSGLSELANALGLKVLPNRIECYDISNIGGHQAVGSMVVLQDGEIDKSAYRKFKIKQDGKPNDFAMHQEVMQRRLKHPEWGMPDLIIIDGGRGQVRASHEELVRAGLTIPIWGIAKRREWLYPPDGNEIRLRRDSLALRLIQKIRDESHRFAITYHRKLRSNKFLGQ
jgi:excinuclease ABC subunit C